MALVGLLLAVCLGFPDAVFGYSPSFYAFYIVAAVGSLAVSGALLLVWGRAVREPALCRLGVLYCCSSVLALGNAIGLSLAAHGVPARLLGGVSPSWLWEIWHVFWPIGVLAAGLRARRLAWVFSAVLMTLAGLVAAGLLWGSSIPFVITDGYFTPAQYLATTLAAMLTMCAIARLVWAPVTREADAWLLVAAIAMLGDTLLAILATAHFSLGTYAARTIGAGSGIVVVAGLARTFFRALARVSALERHATVAERLPIMAFVIDEDLRSRYTNALWREFTGQSHAQAQGFGWSESVHPDDLSDHALAVLFTKKAEVEHEVRIRDREGCYHLHQVRYARFRAPKTDREGFAGWIGVAVNIDRERLLARQSRDAIDLLRKRYDGERRLTQELRSVFQPRLFPAVAGVTFEAVYEPALAATGIGGDWYDAFVLPSGVLAFTIGDASGHDLEAAIAMVRLRETLRTASASADGLPSKALELANHVIASTHDVIASALIAFYDPKRSSLILASAGHPLPVLVRNGKAGLTGSSGMVLGVLDTVSYVDTTVSLQPGDRLAFYTDGLIEANKDPVDGEQRLLEALEGTPTLGLRQLVAGLLGESQTDDATLVVVTYDGAPMKSATQFFEGHIFEPLRRIS
jgi:PAS domain S-box-containing protein